MSSDFRGAQPRPHITNKAALARGKNGRRRSTALQGISLGADAPRSYQNWRDDLRVVRFVQASTARGGFLSKQRHLGDLGGQSHTYTYSIKQTGGEVIRCVCQAFRRGASGGVESGWHKILIGNAFGNLRLWSNEGEWVTTA